MRAVRHLSKLTETVEHRLNKLEVSIAGQHLPVTFDRDRAAAFAVIELDNLWSSFVRSYYLSWFLRAKTGAGVRVTLTVTSPKDRMAAMHLASTILYGKTQKGKTGRIEPAWHEKRVLTVLATGCGANHSLQVQQAMSTNATVFDFLHTTRNFFAHRCEETATKLPRVARSFGLLPSRRGSEIVLGVPLGRQGPLLLDWIAEVRGAAQLLC